MLFLRPGKLERNRGNDLLIKLLEYRYPRVVDLPLLRQWLGAESNERAALLHKFDVNNGQLIQNLKQYINENGISFPMLIGENWVENKKSQMTLYLVSYVTNNYCWISKLICTFSSSTRQIDTW